MLPTLLPTGGHPEPGVVLVHPNLFIHQLVQPPSEST